MSEILRRLSSWHSEEQTKSTQLDHTIARRLIEQNGNINEIKKLASRLGVNMVGGENLETLLNCASRYRKHDIVQLLLDMNADVSLRDRKQCTPLHWATYRGDRETVDLLLQYNATLNVPDSRGFTPLLLASQQGHSDILQCLLQMKADPIVYGNDHASALHLASAYGHNNCIPMLLEAGIPIDAVVASGESALFLACKQGHEAVVKLLLDQSANVNTKYRNGLTCVQITSHRGHDRILELLIAHDADTNICDKHGRTCLHLAASAGHADICSFLLGANADTEAKDFQDGDSAMHLAACAGEIGIVRLLIEGNASIDGANNQGATPLMTACAQGHRQIVSILIGARADVNLARDDGVTSIMYAAKKGCASIVETLIAHGARTSALDNSGRSALDYASSKHESVVSILQADCVETHIGGASMDDMEMSEALKDAHVAGPFPFDISSSDTNSAGWSSTSLDLDHSEKPWTIYNKLRQSAADAEKISSKQAISEPELELSPGVMLFLETLGYGKYNIQIATEFESVAAIAQSWEEREFKLFAQEYGPMKKHHAKRILSEAHKNCNISATSATTSESTIKSLTLHELRRLQGVIQRFLIRADPNLSSLEEQLQGDSTLKQAIDDLFDEGKITDNQRKCLHTLRMGQTHFRNGSEYLRDPNLHISENIQQALDFLGIPRSEVSERQQFNEVVPVGMVSEWYTE